MLLMTFSIRQVFEPQNTITRSSYAGDWSKPKTPATFVLPTYGLGWRQGFYNGTNEFLRLNA